MTDDKQDLPDIDWSQLEGLDADVEAGRDPGQSTVNSAMLGRRLLWDLAQCADVRPIAKAIGLPDASEDVEEMEHQESHKRMAVANLIAPFVNTISGHASIAAVASVLHNAGVLDEVPTEVRQAQSAQMQQTYFAVTMAVLSELLDMNILMIPENAVFTYGASTGEMTVGFMKPVEGAEEE